MRNSAEGNRILRRFTGFPRTGTEFQVKSSYSEAGRRVFFPSQPRGFAGGGAEKNPAGDYSINIIRYLCAYLSRPIPRF
jgi:hypothetical protein